MSNPYPRTAQTSLTRAELTEKAVDLVREGKSYRQVAAALGISLGTAHNYVKDALAALPVQAATELRALEDMRLEMLWEKAVEQLTPRTVEAFDASGEPIEIEVYDQVPRVIETARKLSESRRKLHGLDAPQQVQGAFTVAYTVNGVDPGALT